MELQTLKNACRNIQYGYTASATEEVADAKFLRITDIQGGVVDWKKVPYCIIDEANKDRNWRKLAQRKIDEINNPTKYEK